MSTEITLKYCGMEGTGATVKLAKQDAVRKIEAALDGYYTPYVIVHGGNIGIVARDPKQGYGYRILFDPQPATSGPCFISYCSDDEHVARNRCAWHMAQVSGTYAGLDQHLNDRDRRELDHYYAWQETYREVFHAGATDEQARESANRNN